MPVFYTQSVDPSPNTDQYVTNEPQRKKLKRDYLGNIMGTRRSISPEDGRTSLEMDNGRPLSRVEIIERLKRSKQHSMTVEQIKHAEVDVPLRSSNVAFDLDQSMEQRQSYVNEDSYDAGMTIERPRSALHSGDFREQSHSDSYEDLTSSQLFAASLDNKQHHLKQSSTSSHDADSTDLSEASPPATGARSFTNLFLPPTSPLIHASRSTDLDDLDFENTPSISSRRRTFSPPSLQSARSDSSHPSFLGRFSHLPAYRAHQPHRPISIPQPPRLRPRGVSSSSDASPLQHAPMVGSYEESILRGRMSANPSRPLDFIAQIGVLGRGKCKPSLRCPAHVTVPFPAVFYSLNGTGKAAESAPSPYVGLIDIEHSFPDYEGRSPSGGCYRIPQQGQLQIIIKNPNKTAVKLFLVPYDLSDMEPGTKTFIRQRSYSAGPIIDMPVSSRSNLGTDRPEAAISHSEDPTDRPTLRYLIHLHICCTARGRYFLYRSIRVVFANRVPDGKEKLRNEVQMPEPRYATYRPGSLTSSVASSPAGGRQFATFNNPAMRRLSTPFAFAAFSMDQADGLTARTASTASHMSPPLSAAAVQRRIASTGSTNDAQPRRLSAIFNLTPSGAQTVPDNSATKSAGVDAASDEPVVLMESFETWLNRRRLNSEAGVGNATLTTGNSDGTGNGNGDGHSTQTQ